MVSLPRALDDDLQKSTGLTLSEYIVLMHLSEVLDRELRMTDPAIAASRRVPAEAVLVTGPRPLGDLLADATGDQHRELGGRPVDAVTERRVAPVLGGGQRRLEGGRPT